MSLESIGNFHALPAAKKSEWHRQSDKLCTEYYQGLIHEHPAHSANDRIRLTKAIINKHANPQLVTLSLQEEALLDALPSFDASKSSLEEYCAAVSNYINKMNIKE